MVMYLLPVQDCVVMIVSDGGWHDRGCQEQYQFVCTYDPHQQRDPCFGGMHSKIFKLKTRHFIASKSGHRIQIVRASKIFVYQVLITTG